MRVNPRGNGTQTVALGGTFHKILGTQDPATNNGQTPGGEIVYLDRGGEVQQPRTKKDMPPKFLGGAVAVIPPGADRRQALADWVTSPDNPFFAKATVNRVWFHLTGKGIVDPVDDFRDTNPPSNPQLLQALVDDFAKNGYRLKPLIRTELHFGCARVYELR